MSYLKNKNKVLHIHISKEQGKRVYSWRWNTFFAPKIYIQELLFLFISQRKPLFKKFLMLKKKTAIKANIFPLWCWQEGGTLFWVWSHRATPSTHHLYCWSIMHCKVGKGVGIILTWRQGNRRGGVLFIWNKKEESKVKEKRTSSWVSWEKRNLQKKKRNYTKHSTDE